jgi:hypothetical protein
VDALVVRTSQDNLVMLAPNIGPLSHIERKEAKLPSGARSWDVPRSKN